MMVRRDVRSDRVSLVQRSVGVLALVREDATGLAREFGVSILKGDSSLGLTAQCRYVLPVTATG
jgi:hypothetical protein